MSIDRNADTRNLPTRSTVKPPVRKLARPERSAAPNRRRGLRFSVKLFLITAAFVGLSLVAALGSATWRFRVATEASLRQDLATLPTIFGAYRDDRAAALVAALSSLGEESGTKALYADGVSARTRYVWCQDTADLLRAGTVFLIDRGASLLARSGVDTGGELGTSFRDVAWVRGVLSSAGPSTAMIRERSVLGLVVAVPVISGEGAGARLDGVLAASFPLDAAELQRLAGMTRADLGLLTVEAGGGEAHFVAVTDADGAADVATGLRDVGLASRLMSANEVLPPLELRTASGAMFVTAVPLRTAGSITLGALVGWRSRAREMEGFESIRNSLLLFGALALLAMLPVCFLVGRRLGGPLMSLARSAQAVREGRLAVELPRGGGRELVDLTDAFADMIAELKEKASLEALLAELHKKNSAVASRPVVTTDATSLPTDRYTLIAPLGRGGMGAVYRVRDEQLDEEVALKVIEADTLKNFDAVAALKNEIRLARRISHPNVVRTHDLGEENGVLFLTMELVPGTTLRRIIDAQGPLSFAPAMQIAKQACRGLGAVHDAGIIHRDFKPQNVMVLPNGTTKLVDFGISVFAGGTSPLDAARTIGTPSYMSPEQFRGEPLTPATDLYAFGLTLFECLTGELPFKGTRERLREQHLEVEAPKLRSLRPDVPALLERIVASCLAKDPKKRPPSARDLHGLLMRTIRYFEAAEDAYG